MSDDPATTCAPHPPPTADGLPRSFDPAWRTKTVSALAKGIEAETAFDRLPILADALEEAGCDDELLLRHCRECHWHEEECWAVSFALDRPPPPTWEQLQEMISRLAAARPASQPAAPPAPAEEGTGSRGFGLTGLLVLSMLFGVVRVFINSPEKPPAPELKPIPVDRLFSPVGPDGRPIDELTTRQRAKLERIGREIDHLADHGPPHPDAVLRKQVELWVAYGEAKKTAQLLDRPPPERPPQLVDFHPVARRD